VDREPCVGSNKLPQSLLPGAMASPRLSLQHSSVPKHLGSEVKEDQVGIQDPQEFPHSGIGGNSCRQNKTVLNKGGLR
jgi:hypothetical protein